MRNKKWVALIIFGAILVSCVYVVRGPSYGIIASAVTDSWEYDAQEARAESREGLIRLNNSEYYATVATGDTGTDTDGFVRTLHIWDDNGTIQETVIDNYEFDPASGRCAAIKQVPGTDKYVIAFGNTGYARVRVVTVQIKEDGDITNSFIDIVNLTYGLWVTQLGSLSLLAVTNNVFAVAYTDSPTADGFMETIWVNTSGTINHTLLDLIEFDIAQCYSPYLDYVDSDTVLISYINVFSDLCLKTVNVSSSGDISATVADYWVPAAGSDSFPVSIRLSEIASYTYFDIVYIDGALDIQSKTVKIDLTGMFTKSWIDTLMVTAGFEIRYLTPFVVNDPSSGPGVVGVTFYGINSSQADGYTATWNVSSIGVLDASIIDRFVFTTDLQNYAPIVQGNESYYISIYSDVSSDGYVITYTINTNYAMPIVSGVYPANYQIDVEITPTCAITVNDLNGDLMNITWEAFIGATYFTKQVNNSVGNGTYRWVYTDASVNGVLYIWRVSISDGTHNTSYVYVFTTIASGANTAPDQSNPSPVNVSSCQDLKPTLAITITDADGDTMNLTWRSNSSGSWLQFGKNLSIVNGTYHQVANNFSTAGRTYWWQVILNDGMGGWDNHTYKFTTSPVPIVTLISPANGSTGVNLAPTCSVWSNETCGEGLTTKWYTNESGTWTLQQTNITIANFTVRWNFVTASSYSTMYWWNATVNDTQGNVTVRWFYFTTMDAPPITPASLFNMNLYVHNPNPGNGTHNKNYLKKDATGLTTSVDVVCVNFTDPPANIPGAYSMTITGTDFSDSKDTIWRTSITYNDAWANATGIISPGPIYIGQYENAGDYTILRSFLRFDTSVLPDDATITSAYVQLVVYDNDYSVEDFNVTLQETKPPVPHDPMQVGDYNKASFAGNGGQKNTSGYAADSIFNIPLRSSGASGIAWIDLDGMTNWSLRSDQDVNNSEPGVGVDEFIIFYTYGIPAAYYPKLIVNYTIPAINWEHVVNLTWKSNSGGTWIQYNRTHVVSNGTVTVDQENFTGTDTYYWNISWESNHTNYGNSSIWWFETVNTSSGAVIIIDSGRGWLPMALALSLLWLPLALVFMKRKKRNTGG